MTTFSEFTPVADILSSAHQSCEVLDENDLNHFKHWDVPYVATPVNAEQLRIQVESEDGKETDEYTSLYMNFAFDQVDQRLRNALAFPPDAIDQAETWAAVRKLLQAGVYGELFRSMAASSIDSAVVDMSVDRNSKLLDWATWGNALPDHLLELLIRNPAIGNLEIAKQTSPLDWRAMKNINIVIDMAMADAGFTFLAPDQQNVNYSIMRFDYMQDPRVALMVRHATVGRHETGVGAFSILQRDIFAVDITRSDTKTSREIVSWTENPDVAMRFKGGCEVIYDGGQRLARFVEGESQTYSNGRVGAVMPAVRTYTAEYVAAPLE